MSDLNNHKYNKLMCYMFEQTVSDRVNRVFCFYLYSVIFNAAPSLWLFSTSKIAKKMSGDEVSGCGVVMEVVEVVRNGVGLVDNPILVLVYFHKALRAEFAELRRVAVEALERGTHGVEVELLVLLRKRFEFLKLFYKYHSAAEDEVNSISSFFRYLCLGL